MTTLSLMEKTIRDADEAGYRLEMVGGMPVWEAHPVLRHQRLVDQIRRTIQPDVSGAAGCECVNYADITVRFPDGSIKRPDISIFCREPDEQDTAVTLMPEAVIEILSRDYAAKDLEVGVPFYRRMQIRDIVVLDPDTNVVLHFRDQEPAREMMSPVEITLACGCRCTV